MYIQYRRQSKANPIGDFWEQQGRLEPILDAKGNRPYGRRDSKSPISVVMIPRGTKVSVRSGNRDWSIRRRAEGYRAVQSCFVAASSLFPRSKRTANCSPIILNASRYVFAVSSRLRGRHSRILDLFTTRIQSR